MLTSFVNDVTRQILLPGPARSSDETRIGGIVSNILFDTYLGGLLTRLGKAAREPELTDTYRAVNSNEINAYSLPGGAARVI